MTFSLLTTSEGVKMGKTVKGALWLDENKTTPYEFYQYWRNIADADVEKCLALLTFLPMDEVRRLGALRDSEINEAKKILAYEVTKQVHGEEKAKAAQPGCRSALWRQAAEGARYPHHPSSAPKTLPPTAASPPCWCSAGWPSPRATRAV